MLVWNGAAAAASGSSPRQAEFERGVCARRRFSVRPVAVFDASSSSYTRRTGAGPLVVHSSYMCWAVCSSGPAALSSLSHFNLNRSNFKFEFQCVPPRKTGLVMHGRRLKLGAVGLQMVRRRRAHIKPVPETISFARAIAGFERGRSQSPAPKRYSQAEFERAVLYGFCGGAALGALAATGLSALSFTRSWRLW
eukprot:SAG22_NODE_1961_length_3243_cov_15.725827_2_plen_194_part_00